MEYLPDFSSRIFSTLRREDPAHAIELRRCEKCNAYSTTPGSCCRLLLPAGPVPTALQFEGWEHMTGGEG